MTNVASLAQLIEIVQQPKLSAHIRFADGSEVRRELHNEGPNSFRVPGDHRGEGYQIAGTNRDLRVIDNEGLIFVATPMEDTQPPSACLPAK